MERMLVEYDLVVLGATELGVRVARRARQMGARVALVEQGVTPIADLRYQTLTQGLPSIPVLVPADRPAWLELTVADALLPWSGESLQLEGIDYIASTGSFIQKPQFGFLKFGFLVNDDLDEQAGPNPQTQRLLRSSRFFIALPGDRENFGLSNAIAPEIWLQSDEVWHCAGKRITLVGDRPVGVELAQSLRSLGAQVTWIVPQLEFLSQFDGAFAQQLQWKLEQQGIEIRNQAGWQAGDDLPESDVVLLASHSRRCTPDRVGLHNFQGRVAKRKQLRWPILSDSLMMDGPMIAEAQVQQLLKPWEPGLRSVQVTRFYTIPAVDFRDYCRPPKPVILKGLLPSDGSGDRLWYSIQFNLQGQLERAKLVGDATPKLDQWLLFVMHEKIPLSEWRSLPGLTPIVSNAIDHWDMEYGDLTGRDRRLSHQFFLDWLGFVRRRSK